MHPGGSGGYNFHSLSLSGSRETMLITLLVILSVLAWVSIICVYFHAEIVSALANRFKRDKPPAAPATMTGKLPGAPPQDAPIFERAPTGRQN
ncbi:hypothetical protein Amme_036_013 [Acidomonas methanolica NBRC 104435]|uniref:Uncharacterized protein n=2 Tax=Acidomonas methanolica TaxID=437 RepID=A0A023D4P4_ACIMT|nr:hypothetical protein Amme_036_013 [Acidomonas methanolica NBRC 104435]GEK97933.1 hypothetical protein AME01nite_04320 [Acidomonas methanolica NBRC 104435]